MKSSMQSKLEQLQARLKELDSLLSHEDVVQNMDQYRKLTREHADINPIVSKFSQYQSAEQDELAAQEMKLDPSSKDFAEDEIKSAKERMLILEDELQKLLLPKDPNDDKNIFFRDQGRYWW